MRPRFGPFHFRQRNSRKWRITWIALAIAVTVSSAMFVRALASPEEPPEPPIIPQAIPLPAPAPLKDMVVPEPPDLGEYIRDREAAIQLGKALFWDMQLGSDGQMACASCHFHAGADNRTRNTIHPGPDGVFEAVARANESVPASQYPFHQRQDPDDQTSAVTRDFDDITGSQGVRAREFIDIVPGQAVENTIPADESTFLMEDSHIRRVTPRNAPTVINAVFNFDNLWDGSAKNIFNGVNPHGASDPDSKVFVANGSQLEPTLVRIRNASLASQAVGPPMNNSEMSAMGRTFPKLGKKMLTLTPLTQQHVDSDDSVLGPLVPAGGEPGLTTTYVEMIEKAFQPKWWSNDTHIVTYTNGAPSILPHPGTPLNTNQFTQMEANFSLFFGLAVQMYESTLVSDQTPFDHVLEGQRAFTPLEEVGNAIFAGECAVCHAGSEFTSAAYSNLAFAQGGEPLLAEVMLNNGLAQSIYDDGFFNIGVTRTGDDLARGALDRFDMPLSYSRLGILKKLGQIPEYFLPFVWDLPANAKTNMPVTVAGAFKAPTLRNIELTGPYFHNGGMNTLAQVVEFYTRGGNHPVENKVDLDPLMIELPELKDNPQLQAALIAFLHTLTDDRVRYEQAPFDHPELFVPDRADPNDPSQDEMIHIPAVGAGGRPDPIQPFALGDLGTPPVIVDDVFSVPYGSSGVVLNVLFNDGDLDGNPIQVVAVTQPGQGGSVALGPEFATVIYTAPDGYQGIDSFTYTVTDGVNITEGTVLLTVQPPGNRAPQAQHDMELPFMIVPYNGVDVAVPVLANDVDLDDNPIYIVSVSNVTNGTARIDPVGDQVLFTPTPGFTGRASFRYTISDGVATSSADVFVQVNAWPQANEDYITVRAGSANNRLWVLENDIDLNSAEPEDILTIIAFDTPFKGTATIDPTGSYIIYTPHPGVTGIERFTYYVSDGNVASHARVTINIQGNATPLVLGDKFTVFTNSKNNWFDVVDNDVDEDGDALVIVAVTDASHGQVSIVGNRLLYVPDTDYYGPDSFYYTISDGHDGVSQAKVTVNVTLGSRMFMPFLSAP